MATATIQLQCSFTANAVTPTYARHSFSTIQYQNEVPTTFVEYMLGHKLPGSGSNYFGGYSMDALYKYNSKLLKVSA